MKLMLIAILSFVTGCRLGNPIQEAPRDSGLSEIRINFDQSKFPFKDGLDAAKKQDFFTKTVFRLNVKKAPSSASKSCIELLNKTIPWNQKISESVTKQCDILLNLEIIAADGSKIYFRAPSELPVQVKDTPPQVPIQLCLVPGSAPEMFDESKLACVGNNAQNAIDLEINPQIGPPNNAQLPQQDQMVELVAVDPNRDLYENAENLYISLEQPKNNLVYGLQFFIIGDKVLTQLPEGPIKSNLMVNFDGSSTPGAADEWKKPVKFDRPLKVESYGGGLSNTLPGYHIGFYVKKDGKNIGRISAFGMAGRTAAHFNAVSPIFKLLMAKPGTAP